MARNPNNSDNDSNPNNPTYSTEHLTSEMRRALFRQEGSTQELEALRARQNQIVGTGIYGAVTSNRDLLQNPDTLVAYEREKQRLRELKIREDALMASQRHRVQSVFFGSIERSAGASVNGQVATSLGTPSGFGVSSQLASSMSPSAIEQSMIKTRARMSEFSSQAQDILPHVLSDDLNRPDPDAVGQMNSVMRQIERQRQKLIRLGGAAQIQRRQGGDYGGVYEAAGGAVQDIRTGRGDIGPASSLLGQSDQDFHSGMRSAEDKLIKAFERLERAGDKTGKVLEDVSNAHGELRQWQAAAAAGGGGRGSRVLDAIAVGGSAVQSIAGSIAGTIQTIGVNQRLAQLQNAAGMAGIENQKYDMYRKAAAGDVESQLLLSQWGKAQGVGADVGYAAQTAVATQGVGSVAGAIGDTAGMINAVKSGNVKGGTAGYANAVGGLGNAATGLNDWWNNVSKQQAMIAGTQQDMEARRALLHVSAQQMQGFRDFGVGLSQAAMGMGGAGNAFMDRMTTQNMVQLPMLTRMANAGISPEQMAQMSQMGVEQMGSRFNEEQIFRSRTLERAGYGTMEQNMMRQGVLAGAGANNPMAGLAEAMTNAMAKGMDSSKAMSQMVENTASLTAASMGRAAGLDVTAANAALVAGNVNTQDPNQEFAAKRAMTVEQIAQHIGTNTEVSFAGMMATSRIQHLTGLSGTQSILAQKLGDDELRTLRGMGGTDQEAYLRNKGIHMTGSNMVGQLTEARARTLLEAGGPGFNYPNLDKNALLKQIKQGTWYEDLDKGTQEDLGGVANFAGFSGGGEMYRMMGGRTSELTPEQRKEHEDKLGGGATSEVRKTADDMRTQGFKQLSQAASEATTGFKDAATALKALGELAKSVGVAPDKEGKYKTAATDAAAFGKHVDSFHTAVTQFQKAVGAMSTKAGLDDESLLTKTVRELDQRWSQSK